MSVRKLSTSLARLLAHNAGQEGGADGRLPSIWGVAQSLVIGVAVAAIAVAIRAALPLPTVVNPFTIVFLALTIATFYANLLVRISMALAGAVLTWRFVMSPGSWKMTLIEGYTLLGYATVAIALLFTSELYRRSEKRNEQALLALARSEAEQQRLFARELSHRLKNVLAIVQAIAGQPFGRGAPEVDMFASRLKALGNVHNLLLDHVERPTASVRSLVEGALAPFAGFPGSIRSSGPDFDLDSQLAVSMALALHELGTNATKHGALSVDSGWVEVEWQRVESKMHLQWREHGGPPVSPPTRVGFGTKLLTKGGMGADLTFEPDGLRCSITTDLGAQ